MRTRVGWARIAILAVLVLFVLRAAQWTLLQGDDLAERARSNVLTRRWLPGPRGAIYDAEGFPLAINTRTYTLEMARFRNSPDDIRRTVATLGGLVGRPLDGAADRVLHAKSRWDRTTVCRGLTLAEITPILERRPSLSGVLPPVVVDRRQYPLGRAAAPVVGYTTGLWASELELAKEEGLSFDQPIGRAGLEKHYEMELRGQRGVEVVERDARGRRHRTLTEKAGSPGDDLFTTIDSSLQQTAYELLKGYTGVILAMDPHTGEMMVLAVRPSFDPEAPGRESPDGEPISYLNRAVTQHYPPGSPFKIVTTVAGLCQGQRVDRLRECTGRFYLPSGPERPFYCDNRSGHGYIGLSAAIKYSCNVYFYGLAADVGPQALLDAARLFQLDRPTGIDLPGEVGGTLHSLAPETLDDIQEILLGIGQGPLAMTPTQILRLTAAVANRGQLVTPHLVKTRVAPGGEAKPLLPHPVVPLTLAPSIWEALAEAMNRAVNEEGGTAFRADFPPSWEVCGKTGTAQRPPGEPDAWFVGFAPRQRPEIVFTVMLEHAGHGGDQAAPLARELLAAWFERKRTVHTIPETTEAIQPRPVPGGGDDTVHHDPPSSPTHPVSRSPALMSPNTLRPASDFEWVRGGVTRGPKDKKQISLVFTGGDFGEGGLEILDTLNQRGIQGAFFFTGDFLRHAEFHEIVRRVLAEGHYLGPHSDKHLLYCPWDDRDKTLVTRQEFEADLKKNLDDLCARGAQRDAITWWIPPYEWYNDNISHWSLGLGVRLFNFTPGTLSHTDYTEADAKNYRPNDVIYKSILDYESRHADGLNGFLLLTHVGASPKRPDKFYKHLPALLDELKRRGYTFVPLQQMLAGAPRRP